MGKTLIIVESGTKAKKLLDFVGNNYIIKPSVGHIRDLPENRMGIDSESFKLEYLVSDGKKAIVAGLKKAVQEADRVLLGTDPDREGEAISWHLAEELRLKNAECVRFHEITKEAVLEALNNPRPIDMNLVHAQEARRALDRICGYRVSGPITSMCHSQIPLSAGRVQSPTVRIIVEREREIRNFKSVNHFGASLFFDGPDGTWKADWNSKPFLPEPNSDGVAYFMDEAFAKKVSEIKNVSVVSCVESTRKASPPEPFITSTLQRAASAKYGINPKKCMQIAQKLFEEGYITYLRTDSANLSDEFFSNAVAYCKANNLDHIDKKRVYSNKESAQEAHEAIRPTHIENLDCEGSPEERSVYRMIRDRALAACMPDAQFDVRTATLTAKLDSGETCTFTGKGEVRTYAGWQNLTKNDDTDEDKVETASNPVPKLEKNEELQVKKGQVEFKKTNPPGRFSEAALISEMEKCGIGRPATFAAILETIKTRGYVAIDKKKLVPTALGEQIVDMLIKHNFCFIDIKFTSRIEKDLDLIADGKDSYERNVSAMWKQIDTELNAMFSGQGCKKCPECGSFLQKRTSKKNGRDFYLCDNNSAHGGAAAFFGIAENGDPVVMNQTKEGTDPCPMPGCTGKVSRHAYKDASKGFFWTCPVCEKEKRNHFFEDVDGKPFAPKMEKCPVDKCKGIVVLKHSDKTNSDYWFCQECKNAGRNPFFKDENGKISLGEKCPICGKGYCSRGTRKNGEGSFWHCNNEKCNAYFADEGGKMEKPLVCPSCGKHGLLKKNRKDGSGSFFACHVCNKMFDDDNGNPVESKSSKTDKCPSCGGVCKYIVSKKDNKPLWVCEMEKIFFEDNNGKPEKTQECPSCHRDAVVARKTQKMNDCFVCMACKTYFNNEGGKLGKPMKK